MLIQGRVISHYLQLNWEHHHIEAHPNHLKSLEIIPTSTSNGWHEVQWNLRPKGGDFFIEQH